MRNLPLNQHRVDHLKPRNSTYDIRDTDLKGFGVRILPSGKKSYFLQTQYEGRRRWTKIGDADAMPEAEARSQARSMLAGVGKGRESVSAQPAEIAFEAVAEEVFAYYRRHWKPRTLAVNLNYYENNIQPWFKGRPVAGITRRDVLEWFESLHAKPASANRSLPVLSVILRQAEVYGYRPEDSNPCKGIKRYRRRARERFLSPEEIYLIRVTNGSFGAGGQCAFHREGGKVFSGNVVWICLPAIGKTLGAAGSAGESMAIPVASSSPHENPQTEPSGVQAASRSYR